jgi:hypothetical protein
MKLKVAVSEFDRLEGAERIVVTGRVISTTQS